MQGVKPWQLAVIVLCVLGAVAMLVINLTGGESPQFASKITLADVQTGELFDVPTGKKALFLPMTRPGAASPTLYPVFEKDGKWLVEQRYRDVQGDVLKNSKVYNPSTGEVAVTGPAKELDL